MIFFRFSACFFCLTLGCLSQNRTFAQSADSIRLPSVPGPFFVENTPIRLQQTAGRLVLEAGEKTDMFRDPNVTYNTDNAPKVLFVADSNFVLTAAIHHNFVSK